MKTRVSTGLKLLLSAALLGLAACGGQTTEAPKAADDAVTTSEDTPINIQVLDNDSASDLNSVTVTVTTPAEHGSTEVLSTKAIRYTPNANFNGADQFKYTIKDGQGRSDTATVRVTVNAVNDAPLIAYFQAVDQTGAELNSGQAPFSANLAWSVSDAEGDPLSCTLDFGDDSQQSVDCGGALLAHEYRKVGSYDATLTVSDGVNTTTASVSISAVSNYDITLRFETDLSESQREAFEWAARRWSEVIVGDLSDVNDYRLEEGACGNENTEVLDIDDLTIFVSVKYMDGEGGVLGSGGPCYLRSDSGLPYVGRVSFDSDDLDNLEDQGKLKSVILHEMGHVLGIGTIWEYFGLLDWEDGVDSCMDASDIYFIGNSASQEWQNTFLQTGNPPVENSGGAGTKCGHWLETRLKNELMTGWLSGDTQPLSRLTAASLEDLGYQIDIYGADEYTLPDNLIATQGSPGILLKEQLIYPKVAPDAR